MDVGIQIEPQFGFAWSDIRAIAQEAEAAGYRALWLSDHLFLDAHRPLLDCLEAWTTVAALAASTTRIRLGTMVTCQSFRDPALLAKMAATADRISGGRLEFGIGAGWNEAEYRAYGYTFPPGEVRARQLAEAIQICVRLWSEDRATFRGRYYSVEDAPCAPKPLQDPLPIWLGARRRGLFRLAARRAHALNWLPEAGFPTPAQVSDAMRDLAGICREVGRDPRTLRRSVFLGVVVARSRPELDRILADVAGRERLAPKAWLAARPGLVVGTPDEARDRMREYAAAGADDANVRFPYGYEREMLTLFAETLPALRAAPQCFPE